MKLLVISMLCISMVLSQETGDYREPAPSSSPFNKNDASSGHPPSANPGFSNQLPTTNYGSAPSDFSNTGRIDGLNNNNQGPEYSDDQYSSYYPSSKDTYGGYGGSSGGYGQGGYSGGGYKDNNQDNHHGGYHSGGYQDDHHADGYDSEASTKGPFSGLLKAGALLLPILLILGLGLFFPQVINVPVNKRKKRDAAVNSYRVQAGMLVDEETLHHATEMLVRATEEDKCLEYVVCKLGEKSKSFPLRARVLSLIQTFLPKELKDYFEVFIRASKVQKCTMKLPKKCHYS